MLITILLTDSQTCLIRERSHGQLTVLLTATASWPGLLSDIFKMSMPAIESVKRGGRVHVNNRSRRGRLQISKRTCDSCYTISHPLTK